MNSLGSDPNKINPRVSQLFHHFDAVVCQIYSSFPHVIIIQSLHISFHFCLQVPVDLAFDHSVQVHVARQERDLRKGMQLESDINSERFIFLKWGSLAFYNMVMASPRSRNDHQVHNVSVILVWNSDNVSLI